MAQSNFEENSEIEELHIEPTDVMTGDRNKSRYLLYQLKLSMARAKQIDIIVSFLMESGVISLKFALHSGVIKGENMQIFVDADACPVVGIVEEIAKEHSVPVTLLCDTNHVLSSDYSEVIVVGAGADAVDYKLISICHKGDIVVSQDYGVAAMALGKNAYAIHQSGKWQT